MTNTELLQNIDKDLSKINATREAHVEIQQIMDFYRQRVEVSEKAKVKSESVNPQQNEGVK